jgi:hypothetical protein
MRGVYVRECVNERVVYERVNERSVRDECKRGVYERSV